MTDAKNKTETPAEANKPMKFKYKSLGKSGLRVSELCLGTMTFGTNAWGLPTSDGANTDFEILDAFVEAGGNFIDTANIYSNGGSEAIIGAWLTQKKINRSSVVIATKVRGRMGDGPNDIGLSRNHIFKSVQDSLDRLQTNYIDLLQVHWWDSRTPLLETLEALNDLVRSGKVRYIGVSNFLGFQLQKALDLSEFHHLARFICLQPEYNLICRSTEWELLPLSKAEGLGVIPWSPLSGGWLSGKYKREMKEPPKGTRVEWAEKVKWQETDWSSKNNERTWRILDEVNKIAEELKATPAQVSLRWLMQNPIVTAPIIGAKNLAQLQDNMKAAAITLSDSQMERLNKASELTPPYPYSFLASQDF